MNFLEIVQRLHSETQSGTGSRPSTVVSQSGDLKRLVDWAASAYKDIQQRHPNWQWLRSEFTFNTVALDDTYAYTDCTDVEAAATISRWRSWWPFDDMGCFNVRIYLQSGGVGGQGYLPFIPWRDFRALYKHGTQNAAQPAHCTIDPQGRWVIGPKPDAVYVVSGEYQKSSQVLALDADTPEVHTDYHELVVYWAMEKYGASKVSVENFNRAQLEGGRLMRALELKELPQLAVAGPLA